MLHGTNISIVPLIAQGNFTIEQLLEMLNRKSQFYEGPLEGIYIRVQDNKTLKQRAKIVRHDFLQKDSNDQEVRHYSKNIMIRNILKFN
jgi:atypical dual specificity phosphatase